MNFSLIQFKVVLFGATCSPYLLKETLQTHLSQNEKNEKDETNILNHRPSSQVLGLVNDKSENVLSNFVN